MRGRTPDIALIIRPTYAVRDQKGAFNSPLNFSESTQLGKSAAWPLLVGVDWLAARGTVLAPTTMVQPRSRTSDRSTSFASLLSQSASSGSTALCHALGQSAISDIIW